MVSTEIVDIMKAAGIDSPDISILSDDFLAEVRELDKKNLALEALRKLINGVCLGARRCGTAVVSDGGSLNVPIGPDPRLNEKLRVPDGLAARLRDLAGSLRGHRPPGRPGRLRVRRLHARARDAGRRRHAALGFGREAYRRFVSAYRHFDHVHHQCMAGPHWYVALLRVSLAAKGGYGVAQSLGGNLIASGAEIEYYPNVFGAKSLHITVRWA